LEKKQGGLLSSKTWMPLFKARAPKKPQADSGKLGNWFSAKKQKEKEKGFDKFNTR